MIYYKNLIIIGTSHISIESIKEVEKIIGENKPDIVALELDKPRFGALMYGGKKAGLRDIFSIGIKGYIFSLIGAYAEKKLGSIVDVSPGSEMKRAAEVAKENGCRIALIDQRIDVTLKRFSKEITWKEKFRFLFDLIKGIFKKEKISFDLNKVPSNEIIKKMLDHVKKRYPNVYKVLVYERNLVMAKHLYSLMGNYNHIVAVVGAGHSDDIIEEIKCLEKKR